MTNAPLPISKHCFALLLKHVYSSDHLCLSLDTLANHFPMRSRRTIKPTKRLYEDDGKRMCPFGAAGHRPLGFQVAGDGTMVHRESVAMLRTLMSLRASIRIEYMLLIILRGLCVIVLHFPSSCLVNTPPQRPYLSTMYIPEDVACKW